MRVSVVVNTYNRAATLPFVLDGLRRQTYGEFEVVVVNGPSTDGTEELLRRHADWIRVERCDEANLCNSRNVGIAAAAGEIVAFLDDDAIPDTHYLERIVAGYDSERVGGVGGLVYDNTGYALQYNPAVCDRRCNGLSEVEPPLWGYQAAHGDGFVHLLGCASSFRRRCLVEIGGFDEEIEYFLDETEVCLRITDAGYWLRRMEAAFVIHKFAPSHLRGEQRVLRKPFPIVKNKFYVALRVARPTDPVEAVLNDCQRLADQLVEGARWHASEGRMTLDEVSTFASEADRGIWEGIARGRHRPRQSRELPPADDERFLPYPVLRPVQRRMTVCFVSQDLPSETPGGIGRFTYDLAQGFADAGHEVHFLAASTDHDRLDLKEGVWVHRLRATTEGAWNTSDLSPTIRKNLARAAAVHRAVRRIAETRTVDLVVVPIWDCEGIFCLLDDDLTCVLTLQTTFKTFADLNPAWKDSLELPRMLALEQATLRAARHVHAISQNILDKVRLDYGVPETAFLVHLGIRDRSAEFTPRPSAGGLRVLFASRVEKRKGADLFLEAALALAREFDDVEFLLVGHDGIASDEGPTYRALFEERHGADPAAARVKFLGMVPEQDLYQHYADCDVFCLPARYESFGLVYVEAMMFGKPVVGCAAGGMTEVVEHGVNGFLAVPGDVASLTDSLRRLLRDEALRHRFGRQSRLRYERLFSDRIMVRNTLRAYEAVVAQSLSA